MSQAIATILLVVSSLIVSVVVTYSAQDLRAQSTIVLSKSVNFVETSSQFLSLE